MECVRQRCRQGSSAADKSLQGSQKRQRTVKLHPSNTVADMIATETNKQILIVDRDVAAIEPLRQRLSEAGFAVRAVTDGSAAVQVLAERPPHLVIIDWNMPGYAALELIQGVRRARVPQAVRLIILSALAGEQDVVSGLNLGADDYIAKPFSLREVVARVSAILRTRLLAQVWGDDHDVDERTVDVNVQRLRRILMEQGYEAYIQTVRGFGYRFFSPTPNGAAPLAPAAASSQTNLSS